MSALKFATFLALIGTAIAVALFPAVAGAQQKFPTKPIRLVVAFTAGGTPDTLARMIAPRLTEVWGQPVVIENRPGAGGTLAAAIVAKAPADGYTLLATSPAFAITAAMNPSLPYDPLKDFAGVSEIGYSTTALVVAPSLGVKTVKELIARANAKGKLLFGSAGAGSATHMNAERFRAAAGIKAQHVGFKGQPEFLIEIVAGRVHFGVAGLGPALPFIKDGRLVPLALATPQRSPVVPDVPAAPEVLPGWAATARRRGSPRPLRHAPSAIKSARRWRARSRIPRSRSASPTSAFRSRRPPPRSTRKTCARISRRFHGLSSRPA